MTPRGTVALALAGIVASAVAGCGDDARRPPPAPPALLDVCRDSVDEPLDVACLVGRPIGEALSCNARVGMGCPTVSGPGYALLGCLDDQGGPNPPATQAWVRWATGPLAEVPTSTAAPTVQVEGAQRKERLDADAIGGRFDALIARARTLGCEMSEIDPGPYVSTAFGRCGGLELEITATTGIGLSSGVTVLVARPAVHDCIWAGKNYGAGTRPRGATKSR